MNQQPSQAMQVVKREEKETKLAQFVLGEIAAGRVTLSEQWNVVALSMDSPVVVALGKVIDDLGGAGSLQVRVLLTGPGKHVAGDTFEMVGQLSIRAASSGHLLDAHEQLVIGSASAWTGDCMRRNPRERDAFETFGANDGQLASWASKSFERLWSGAVPLIDSVRPNGAAGGVAEMDGMLAGDDAMSDVLVTATSRN